MGNQPIILFVHIPKTAGTTFSRIVRLKYGLWPPSNFFNHTMVLGFNNLPTDEARIALLRGLPPAQRQRVRLYQGHFGFGLHELLPIEARYITFLRDPVERVVSLYYMLLRDNRAGVKDAPLEAFAMGETHGHGFHVDNGQVRHLAGTQGRSLDVPFGACNAEHLAQAVANIDEHFALAGISERFDESMLVLRRKLGWRTAFYASANIGTGRKRITEISEEAVQAIRHANALDQELYDFADRRLEEEVKQLGPGFAAELERHRRGNRWYSTLAAPLIEVMPKVKKGLQRVGVGN